MHQCADDKIRCFECKSVICRECMDVTVDSLHCKKCSASMKDTLSSTDAKSSSKSDGKTLPFAVKPSVESPARQQGVGGLQLGVASTVYSFVIMKFLNLISGC